MKYAILMKLPYSHLQITHHPGSIHASPNLLKLRCVGLEESVPPAEKIMHVLSQFVPWWLPSHAAVAAGEHKPYPNEANKYDNGKDCEMHCEGVDQNLEKKTKLP